MLRRIIENNLRKPKGFFGQIIAYKLRSNLPEYVEILKHLNLRDRMKILEIGYGPGYGINYIHDNYDVAIEGIDYSDLMFKMARRKTRKYSNKTKLFCGDFTDHGFEDGYYDRVLLSNVIYFWKDPQENIRKIVRIVKSGGIIGISMAGPDLLTKVKISSSGIFTRHSIPSVVDMLENCGTAVEAIEDKNHQGFFYLVAKKKQQRQYRRPLSERKDCSGG
jgi:SAM-dependent methyltransferase